MTERVQIPAYTDRWMRGDRYGEVVNRRNGHLGRPPEVRVLLDKSRQVIWFIEEHCTAAGETDVAGD